MASMSGPGKMVFPSTGLQVLSLMIEFLGVSILTHCLSRRLMSVNTLSWKGWSSISFPRLLVILVFLDSWLFLFSSGLIIFGIGLETNYAVCSAAIYLCIVFYASSKVLIYFFLMEKVHVVWSPVTGVRRLKSPAYLIAFVVCSFYTVMIVLLFIGRIHEFTESGQCVIGLAHIASIPLASYDFFINCLLTSLFLWPVIRNRNLNPKVKRMANRTLVSAFAALSTSAVNILILTVLHGRELGWVCLGSCGTDVILNALILFWVTGGGNGHTEPPTSTVSKATPHVFQHPQVPPPGAEFTNSVPGTPTTEGRKRNSFLGPSSSASPAHIIFGRSHQRQPSMDKSTQMARGFTRIFRKDQERQMEEHAMQITITKEFDILDDSSPREQDKDNEPHFPSKSDDSV